PAGPADAYSFGEEDGTYLEEEEMEEEGFEEEEWDEPAKAAPADERVTFFRQHVQDLQQALREFPAEDAASRLEWLRQYASELAQLLEELAPFGDQHPSSERLAQTINNVLEVQAESWPADDRVQQVWSELDAALAECLASFSGWRETFWK